MAGSPPRAPNAPLGWLSNMIGGSGKNAPAGGGGSGGGVENCTDVDELAEVVSTSLGLLLSNAGAADADADAAVDVAAPSGEGGEGGGDHFESSDAHTSNAKEASSPEEEGANTAPSPKLAASLSRLKTLLYDERTALTTSASSKHRSLFQGGGNSAASDSSKPPPVAAAAVQSLAVNRPHLIPNLLSNLPLLPFEARKDTTSVLNYLLVCGLPANGALGIGGGASGGGGGGGPSEDDDDKSCWRSYSNVTTDFVHYVDVNFDEVLGPVVRLHDLAQAAAVTTMTKEQQPLPNGGGDNGVGAGEARQQSVAAETTTTMKSTPDVALHCGSLLRSALRHPRLFRQFVSPERAPRFVYPFLDSYVHQPNFEVAGDALETVRVLLIGGGGGAAAAGGQGGEQDQAQAEEESTAQMASAFLERDYAEVVEKRLNRRMLSEQASYVTKRASVQLLSTILLTRSNYAVMMRYIASRSNLRTVMLLLRDPSPHITLDAFHVFKVFVANPSKTPEVVRVLVDNKIKLVRYLAGLHREREDVDEQFRDEKRLVIATLEGLELE